MKFLVIKHTRSEGFGIYEQFCLDAGIDVDYVELAKGDRFPDPQTYDGLWVMGGPMNVEDVDHCPWIADELAFIQRAVRQGLPYFGTCLGAQMLAAATGGQVGFMDKPEVGLLSITLNPVGQQHPLLRGLDVQPNVFQWHGQGVQHLPPGATVLASSPQCPVQIYAVGDRAFGLQFHSEVTPAVMDRWVSIPDYRQDLERSLGMAGREAFHQAVYDQAAAMARDARILFENFVAIAQSSETARPGDIEW
ncbi:MAG TPA: type 1 glutamine amidotransferase [Candidatus Obscuribacterales bacterium]